MIFGSWMLGQALAYAPNVNAAVVSASRIMKLLQRVPAQINPQPSPFKDYEVSSTKFKTHQLQSFFSKLRAQMEKFLTKTLIFVTKHAREFKFSMD